MKNNIVPLILIIDDNFELRMLRQAILQKYGYQVITAEDGKEGLIVANRHVPDLVLLDVVMPGMSGLEVLQELKKNKKTESVFVIMISGQQKTSEDLTKGLELGADGYLTSPIPNNLLVAQLKTFLKHKYNMDKLRISEYDIFTKNEELELAGQSLEQRNLEYQALNKELTRALKSLTASESKYKLLTENLGDVVFTIYLNGKFNYVSPSIIRANGYTPEEMKNLRFGDLLDKPSVELAQNMLENIQQHEKNEILRFDFPLLELRQIKKDGSMYWSEVKLSPIRDKQGKLTEILGVTRNIDQKKAIEDQFIKNLERYHLAQEIGKVGNWEYNIKTGEFWGSDQAKRIYGFDPDTKYFNTEEVEGCIPERERVHQALEDLIEKEKPYDLEFEIIPKKSKAVTTIQSKAQLIKDDDGNPLLVAGVIQDITDRKKTELALKESEEKFKMLAETSPTAILIYQDDRWVYVNKMAEEITGYSADELIGMPFWDIVHPDFRELVKKRGKARQRKEEVELRYEFKIVAKDGTEKWIFISATTTVFMGKPAGIASIMDITRLKDQDKAISESEFRNKLLIENMDAGVGYYTLDSEVVILNKAAARFMAGMPEDFIGKSMYDLFGTEFGEIYHKRIVEASKSDKSLDFEDEVELAGKRYHFLSTYSRIADGEGMFSGVQIISNDITARKTAEIKLKESEERFRFLSEVTFEAIVIHQKGIIIDVNSAFEKITGYTRNEVIGQNLFSALASEKDLEKAKQNVVKEHATPYQIRAAKKDGSLFWAEIEGRNVIRRDEKIRIVAIRDISEKVKARQDLIKSEEKYRGVVNNSLEGIFIIQNSKFVYVNPTFEKMLGYPFKEIATLDFQDFIHPDDKQLVMENNKKRLEGKDLKPYDFRVLNRRSETIWVHLNATKISWNDDDAILCFLTNIHDRKLAEQALKEREQSLKNIVENSTNAFYRHDTNHFINYLSPQIEAIIGFTPEEAMVKWTELTSDHPINMEAYEKTVKAIETGELQDPYQLELVHKSGKKVWVEAREVPIIENNKVIAMAGSLTDITARVKAEKALIESEKRFRTYIQASPTSVILSDENGKHIFVNPAACKMLGYREEEMLKMGLTDILPEQQLQKGLDSFEKLKKEGKSESSELRFKHKSGKEIDVLVEAVRLSENEFMAYCKDITTLKNAERELQKANEEYMVLNEELEKGNQILHATNRELEEAKERAEESDRLKSAFLANMSHEIRTPMNGILGFAELLKEPDLPGDQSQNYVEIIEKSGQRMLNILNDLINISKIEAGQMEVQNIETNIADQAKILHKFFLPETTNKGLAFDLIAEDNLPAKEILTDKEKLYAVLTNLIKNAIKYTHKGSIQFGYKFIPSGKTGHIEFFVKDTGIGIPKEKLAAVFERFIQADNTIAKPYEGAGLGLSISKAYVEMLGGKIWVDSDVDNGSTFYFSLPAKFIEKARKVASQDESGISEKLSALKLKILIVEDSEFSDYYLKRVLQSITGKMFHAVNGKEAVEIARANPDLDLIMMDIRMPIMDGYEATREIRQFNKDVVIIAQTAFAMTRDHEKAIEAGCTSYLTKPVKKNLLLAEISKYFGND